MGTSLEAAGVMPITLLLLFFLLGQSVITAGETHRALIADAKRLKNETQSRVVYQMIQQEDLPRVQVLTQACLLRQRLLVGRDLVKGIYETVTGGKP